MAIKTFWSCLIVFVAAFFLIRLTGPKLVKIDYLTIPVFIFAGAGMVISLIAVIWGG